MSTQRIDTDLALLRDTALCVIPDVVDEPLLYGLSPAHGVAALEIRYPFIMAVTPWNLSIDSYVALLQNYIHDRFRARVPRGTIHMWITTNGYAQEGLQTVPRGVTAVVFVQGLAMPEITSIIETLDT